MRKKSKSNWILLVALITIMALSLAGCANNTSDYRDAAPNNVSPDEKSTASNASDNNGTANSNEKFSAVDIIEVWRNGQDGYIGKKIIETGDLRTVRSVFSGSATLNIEGYIDPENCYTINISDASLGSASLYILGIVTGNTVVSGNMVKSVNVEVRGTITDIDILPSKNFNELQSKGYIFVELDSIKSL